MWYFAKPKKEKIEILSNQLKPWLLRLHMEHDIDLNEEIVAERLLRWRSYRIRKNSREAEFRLNRKNEFYIRVIDRRGEFRDAIQIVFLMLGLFASGILFLQNNGPEGTILGLAIGFFAATSFFYRRMYKFADKKDIWLKKEEMEFEPGGAINSEATASPR